jgi:hypothetical protein
MNERIKELAEQADKLAAAENKHYGLIEYSEKFAELIVRECTILLFDESEKLFTLYSEENNMRTAQEYEICSNQCLNNIALIEKRFGVEQ